MVYLQPINPPVLCVSNAPTEGVLTSKQLRHTIPRSTPSSPTYLPTGHTVRRCRQDLDSHFEKERESKQQGPKLLPTWVPKHLTLSVSRAPLFPPHRRSCLSLSGCWIVQLRAAPLFLCLPLSVSSLFIRLLGLCRSVSRVRPCPETTSSIAAQELLQARRRRKPIWPRGEQQATAMEANLTRLESKLDAMLAQFEKDVGSSTPTAGAPDSSPKANEDNTETKTDEQSKANKSN